ncbi:Ada metal-binding domain-containing protein [Emcibacter sp.]|uniref:Ada metal-binding domain-containing protein n=1 Tax=Emcibacter sp. TaxID=1979954 RepID=UPI003A8E0366
MIGHSDIDKACLRQKIKDGGITFAGNRRLKIYGTLCCPSGKRMKPENRVFFTNEKEAIDCGYRPCGTCMKKDYDEWTSLNA